MLPSQTVAAVIPCLNEVVTIGSVVTEVRKFVSAVYVVDDGSVDQTGQAAEAAGAVVLRNETTQGKGAALTRGWRHAFDSGFKWALCMDGDGQHAPSDIPRFLTVERADLVIGNRMANCGSMPWLRRHVNRWMSNKISQLAGQPLPDTQCGFRLMNLAAWSVLPITPSHFDAESEVLFAFAAARRTIKFVPIAVIYKDEQSKIHPVRDTVRWFRWWARARRRLSALQTESKSLALEPPR